MIHPCASVPIRGQKCLGDVSESATISAIREKKSVIELDLWPQIDSALSAASCKNNWFGFAAGEKALASGRGMALCDRPFCSGCSVAW
jgi:hypothetical protein